MKILEIETFGRGGLIHYAYNLSRALAERGHEVALLTAAQYELDEAGKAGLGPSADLRILRFLGRLSRRAARWPAPLASLTRKVEALLDATRVALQARRLRPDVVHLHCTNPVLLAYVFFLRLTGIPLAVTAHVVTPHERIPLQGLVYRLIHRSSPLVIAHSEFDRKRLLDEFGVDDARTVVIPHGEYGFFEKGGEVMSRAEARRSFGLETHHEVALFFGYVREYKGLDVLLEAWPQVAQERPEARLLIAGDPVRLAGERRQELKDWAERLGAVHRFEYVPFSEVARYFGAADVLVMPYRHISQSGVLYLALSLGVPVVATRVGALPEVLDEGESALLVPPEDPAALATALLKTLGRPDLLKRLAEGGRSVAKSHSWPAIAERTEVAFQDAFKGLRAP